MSKIKKFSCIIPVFNEERQLASTIDVVLEAARKISMEIIIVDDGSRDQTAAILKNHNGIRTITNKQNMGKSYAVARGLEVAKEDYILLLDADLIGLNAQNILALLSPVRNGGADVAMSIRKNSYPHTRMINLDFLTGERVFPRDLIKGRINEIKKLPNFALEVYLNKLIIKNKYSVKSVYWNNVSNHYKIRKRGVITGLKADSLLLYDISKVMPPIGWLQQNISLKRLTVKN